MQLLLVILILQSGVAGPATLVRTGDALTGGQEVIGVPVPRPSLPAPRPASDSVKFEPLDNWPQHMSTNPNYSPSGLAFVDLNGDDTLEVIAGSTDSKLHVWDWHGNELPGWPQTLGGMIQSKVAVGDLLGDGHLKIVVACRDGKVYAFNPDGSPVPGWPQSTTGIIGFISPTLFDLDGNGSLEVIMPSMASGQPGKVYVWKADGTAYPGWPQSTDYLAVATASVADVDGDGLFEICAPSYRSLYLWDQDGNAKSGWPLYLGDGASYAQPEMYDLDGDGKLEIGFASPPTGYGQVFEFRYDGSNQPGWPHTMLAAQPYVCPIAGGVSGDSLLSVFGGGHLFGSPGFYGWYADGGAMPNWPVNPDFLECSPVVFDIEGNYRRGVMVATNTTPGELYAYYDDGTPVPGFPIQTPASASPNSPVVGDVNRDGITEVGLVTSDGSVSLWKVSGLEYHPWLTDWGTFYHDNWNTGWLHPAAPQGLDAERANPGVRLTWQANREPDIAGYQLYRTMNSGRDYRRLNREPIAGTTFLDSLTQGDTVYYYGVSAVIRAGFEGRLSREIAINPTGIAEPGWPQDAGHAGAEPTIIRGMMFWSATTPSLRNAGDIALHAATSLLDISGRKTMDLHPGANDVSRLTPGVYFAARAANGGVIQKFVITR